MPHAITQFKFGIKSSMECCFLTGNVQVKLRVRYKTIPCQISDVRILNQCSTFFVNKSQKDTANLIVSTNLVGFIA